MSDSALDKKPAVNTATKKPVAASAPKPKLPDKKPADVGADAVTRAPSMLAPGKQTVQGTRSPANPTGNAYIDHGAVCEGRTGPGCFLEGPQRGRLIQAFQQRVIEASTNYKVAAVEVRVDQVIKTEDDLDWLTLFILDLATAHMTGALTRAIIKLRAGQAERIAELAREAGLGIGASTSPVHDLLNVSDDHIKSVISTVSAAGKKSFTAAGKKGRSNQTGAGEKKTETIGYIDRLVNQATLSFARIREQVPGSANDVELLALYDAFATEDHLVSAYKVAIEEKLARMEASYVGKVGKAKLIKDRESSVKLRGKFNHDYDPDEDWGAYVVWHTFLSGHPRSLFYQWNGRAPSTFAGETGRTGGQNGIADYEDAPYEVPAEFQEIAIEKHIAAWGAPPGYEQVDDSGYHWDPVRAKKAQENRAKAQPASTAATPAPKPQIEPNPATPVAVPDALKLKPGAP